MVTFRLLEDETAAGVAATGGVLDAAGGVGAARGVGATGGTADPDPSILE